MIKILSRPSEVSAPALEQATQHLRTVLKRADLGFTQLPARAALRESCRAEAQRLQKMSKRLFFFGIGGSSLGPQFLADVFAQPGQVTIIDNPDPHFVKKSLGDAKTWSDAAFVFVSKSGTTLETLSGLQYVHDQLATLDPRWTDRALVVTESKASPLMNWAQAKGVRQVEVPLDVGGRFSVLSPVGMFLAEYLGQDAKAFHDGAAWAATQDKLVAELTAQSLASWKREEWITQFWTYSSSIRNLAAWIVQLWAESLGKAKDRQGKTPARASSPVAALGANDQHSILQQVMEGPRDKWVVLHRVADFGGDIQLAASPVIPELAEIGGKKLGEILNVEARATAEALRRQGVSVLELELQDLKPQTIGAVLQTWMLVVASLGEALDINAFDQPGVELGKRLAKGILKNGVLPEL
ncbi:MAG: glucose-6-phosphate isomerase [Bdellovibrionaceae bacterium]|nr:glucose-6-phosphate isomerase [Pseudobdellovibrionaceae bacterium]